MAPTAHLFRSLLLLLPTILASTIPPPLPLLSKRSPSNFYDDFDRTLKCGDRGISQAVLDAGNAGVPNERPFTRDDFSDSLTKLCNYNSNPTLGNAGCYCAGIPTPGKSLWNVACLPRSLYVPEALWDFQLYCKMLCQCTTHPRYDAEDTPAPKVPVPFPIQGHEVTKPFPKVYSAPDGMTWSYDANGWVSDGSSGGGGGSTSRTGGGEEVQEGEGYCDNAELETYTIGATQRKACASCGTTCQGQADCVAASGLSGCHCYPKAVVTSQLLLGVESGITHTVAKIGVCALSLAASKKMLGSPGLGGRALPAAATAAAAGVLDDDGYDDGGGSCLCNSTFTSSSCCQSYDGLVWDVQNTLLMPLE